MPIELSHPASFLPPDVYISRVIVNTCLLPITSPVGSILYQLLGVSFFVDLILLI